MKIVVREGLEGARAAEGHVVVLDVLRAFTTLAYAFAAGIDEAVLVSTPEEALARPGFRLGEVGGRWIPGFDHDNSPSRLRGRRLSGVAVQRTGAGTRCAVAAERARTLWLASLVVVSATARALLALGDAGEVTLVVSGWPDEGEEDRAAALYLEALLRGEPPPRERVVREVLASRAARLHHAGDPARPLADLECVTSIDAFDFAMRADRRDGVIVARPFTHQRPEERLNATEGGKWLDHGSPSQLAAGEI
ncbi:MAG: 2-phosphosulfolactate phosphatase [Planctomycetes bacterium]|nr:2-phosphosulfolactate phosphatase [Planctomycetota bacterium]